MLRICSRRCTSSKLRSTISTGRPVDLASPCAEAARSGWILLAMSSTGCIARCAAWRSPSRIWS